MAKAMEARREYTRLSVSDCNCHAFSTQKEGRNNDRCASYIYCPSLLTHSMLKSCYI